MDFGHDTQCALRTVVDLVNTTPADDGPDALQSVRDLETFVAAHEISDAGRLAREDLEAVRRLRARLREILEAPPASAVSLVNALIADARTTPRLTDHDGWPLHLHYFAPDARLAEHLAADCGVALAMVLAAGEWERITSCEAPDCDRLLVDLSRNRSRRYCDSKTCGNRLHVAAYRARQRTG